MKKAQSISINTIVVAAIALVVMVVVIMIFTGKIINFNKQADACQNNRGTCYNADEITEKCSGTYDSIGSQYVCYKAGGEPDTTKACCIHVA